MGNTILSIVLFWPIFLLLKFSDLFEFLGDKSIYKSTCPICKFKVKKIFGKTFHSQKECSANLNPSKRRELALKRTLNDTFTIEDLECIMSRGEDKEDKARVGFFGISSKVIRNSFELLFYLIILVMGWTAIIWLTWYFVK